MTQMDFQPPEVASGASDPVIEMHDISIAFGGVPALAGVDLRLFPGEVHALMGENGAGKSTLIKALTGVYAIDSGTVVVGGEAHRFSSPAESQAAGISTVYQEINLAPNLSVAENMLLGREPRRRGGIDVKAMNRQAAATLADETTSVNQADRQVWQEAGTIPLYQQPQVYAQLRALANFGAFGYADIVWQNVGFMSSLPSASATP